MKTPFRQAHRSLPVHRALVFALLCLVSPALCLASDSTAWIIDIFHSKDPSALIKVEELNNQKGIQTRIALPGSPFLQDGLHLVSRNFDSREQALQMAEKWNRAGILANYSVAMTRDFSFPLLAPADDRDRDPLALGRLIASIEGRWGVKLPDDLLEARGVVSLPRIRHIAPTVISAQVAANVGAIPVATAGGADPRPLAGIMLSRVVGAFSLDDKRLLTFQLREISGFQDLHFDDNGLLVTGTAVRGGSAVARDLLRSAMASTDYFRLESYHGNASVLFGAVVSSEYGDASSPVSVNRIQLDFDDFRYLEGDVKVISSFSPGFIFLHELTHVVRKLGDDDRYSGLGECEAYINQIRRELRMPERFRYEFKVRRTPEGREIGELWFISGADPKYGRKLYEKLSWDNEMVGKGLPPIGN